jgi:hypothetical protein
MDSDMPHPCVRKHSTDKAVTKGVPYAQSNSHHQAVDCVRMRLWHKAVAKKAQDPSPSHF